jgi:uncharacterized protein
MTELLMTYGWAIMLAAFAVTLFGGFTKGAVGFALPMIMISGIGSLMSAEVAIAALILPAFATNVLQSLRNGLATAWGSLRKYWKLNLILCVMIFLCAQLVAIFPGWLLFLILGIMVTLFAGLQLIGWRAHFPERMTTAVEVVTALVAGFFGGLSGVWGPPILMYLLAREVPKDELMRVQGISFLIGSIVLIGAHLQSGVLNATTLPFSVLLVIPALAGQMVGRMLHDRLEIEKLRKLILFVLLVAGLNLLRRGLVGM